MPRKFSTAIELPGDPATALQAATKQYVDLFQLLSARGAASGYAPLDSGSKVPIGNLPTGTSGTTVALGNDSRFTDSRPPSGTAGGGLNGTYPNPNIDVVPWPPVTLIEAATIATDASLGNHFRVTLTASRTLGNPTNLTDGQRLTWEVIQDATGGWTLTFDTLFAFGAEIPGVALTAVASKRDFIGGIYCSTPNLIYITSLARGY